jgi:subtilase family serine protease
MKSIARSRLLAALVITICTVVAASVAGTSQAATPSQHVLPMVQGPALSTLPAATPGACYSIFEGVYGIPCWGPYELARSYDFPSNLDGSGQTIIIVDAYGSATIASDLHKFDSLFGIPDPGPGKFIQLQGPPAQHAGSGDREDWGVETSLDVEYAHAMAPGARIVLAVAPSDDDNDLNNTELHILPLFPGAIASHSFGDWETDEGAAAAAIQAHGIYTLATLLGETLVASSGDAGATFTQYTGTTTPALAGYPASDPLVTGVGGTMGDPYPDGLYVFPDLAHFADGSYGGEQTWNEPDYDAATGGAPSMLFPAPSYQHGVTGYNTRTVPDVSYNASIIGGVGVVFTSTVDGLTHLYLVGGTSAGSPQWAAIFALVNQARAQQHRGPLGFANPALYAIAANPSTKSAFHDITVGNNKLDSSVGFNAGPGYDLATGLGTPDVAKLVPLLAAAPGGTRLGGLGALKNIVPFGGHGSKPHTAGTAIPG